MDMNMDPEVLNNILESAFNTVINDPNVINDFNNTFNVNEQNNNINNDHDHENGEPTRNTPTRNTSTRNTDTVNNNDNETDHVHNFSFIKDYIHFLSNYSENMREYSRNVGQMNRCISNIITNTYMQNIPQQRPTRSFRYPNTGLNHTLSSMFPSTQHIRFISPNNTNNTTTNTIPTIPQILRETRIFVFNDETRVGIASEQCSITLNEFSEGDIVAELNHCKHVFKMDSLFTWFSRNSHCPVCRHNISI